MTKKALNELVGRTQAFKKGSNFLDTPATTAARMNDIASSVGGAALRAETATFMVEPLGLGKALCPSVRQLAPNNRVNSTKLRSCTTDNIEPNQAMLSLCSLEGATHRR